MFASKREDKIKVAQHPLMMRLLDRIFFKRDIHREIEQCCQLAVEIRGYKFYENKIQSDRVVSKKDHDAVEKKTSGRKWQSDFFCRCGRE